VAGLLFIGGGFLGAGTLNDISLSLFVGLAAGAYSSIFIATPLVADLKEREPAMRALAKRVRAKRAQAADDGHPGAGGGYSEDAEDSEDATPAVVGPRPRSGTGATSAGPRTQPSSRNRGRGRPSGKRR
jgi:preprotein translocase subunit SecF